MYGFIRPNHILHLNFIEYSRTILSTLRTKKQLKFEKIVLRKFNFKFELLQFSHIQMLFFTEITLFDYNIVVV